MPVEIWSYCGEAERSVLTEVGRLARSDFHSTIGAPVKGIQEVPGS